MLIVCSGAVVREARMLGGLGTLRAWVVGNMAGKLADSTRDGLNAEAFPPAQQSKNASADGQRARLL